MIVRVDRKIIRDHNDIFTTPAVDFIVRLLNCSYPTYTQQCRTRLSNLEEIDLSP